MKKNKGIAAAKKQQKRIEAETRQEAFKTRSPREQLHFMKETGRAHTGEAQELAKWLGVAPNLPSEW